MSEQTPATNEASEEKNISAKVLNQIQEFTAKGEIQMPPNYSPENAIKGAWLVLQETVDRNKKPVLEVCTKVSIASALFKMCMEGLSAFKGQGYFIAYGAKLSWDRDYNGARALAKRVADVKAVPANVVFEGDEFEYSVDLETGMQKLVKHNPNPDNRIMDKLKGAYAIVIYNDGRSHLEYMTKDEIHTAWQQGPNKGTSPAHIKFPQEMFKKTVIKRACKEPINSSDDGYLFAPEVVTDNTEDVPHTVVNETGTKAIDFEVEDPVKSEEIPDLPY
jgi:recombination protein RecT